jgi:hypothetical protein
MYNCLGYNAGLDGYSGDSVLSATNPPYNPSQVLNSEAGLALATVKRQVGAADILELRAQATVTCSSQASSTPCNPRSSNQCLFDLSVDPCEMNDLSAGQPEVLQELNDLLLSYSSSLVPQPSRTYEIASADPANFDNVWSPWRDDV